MFGLKFDYLNDLLKKWNWYGSFGNLVGEGFLDATAMLYNKLGELEHKNLVVHFL